MDQEIKELLEEQAKLWEDTKKINDSRIAALEEGATKVVALEALDQMNTRLDQITDEVKVRMDAIETASKRPPTVGADGKETKEQTPEQAAFYKYLRYGLQAIGEPELKVLNLSNDTQGGYFVEPELNREIIKAVTEISPLRQIARVFQTGANSLKFPKRTGQFTAGWVAEQGTRSETTGLTFGQEEIPTHECYARVDLTRQLLDDSWFDLAAFAREEAALQLDKLEGGAFISGTGVGRPEGLLSVPAGLSTTNSGAATTIQDANGQGNGIIELVHAVKSEYARNGRFILNRTTLGSMRKLQDSQKRYLWEPGLPNGNPPSILGYPYSEMSDMPDEGAGNKPIIFGDFRMGYYIVDRMNLSVLVDPYSSASSGAILYYFTRRVGGQVVLSDALRALTCSA